MANCSSCGAEIIWGQTMNGKRMPLSKKSQEARWFFPAEGSDYVQMFDSYISHFADCPNAAQHRKSRGPNAENS